MQDRKNYVTAAAAPDVLGELARIEELARNAIANLASGHGTTGVSALNRIQDRAGGAIRDELERRRIAELMADEGLSVDAAQARARSERLAGDKLGINVRTDSRVAPGRVIIA